MARQDKVPIDEVIWNFYTQPKKSLQGCMDDTYNNDYTVPQIGCYVFGLFMEGARWDDDRNCIHESLPKVLFDIFPVILMMPVPIMPDDDDDSTWDDTETYWIRRGAAMLTQ